MIRKGRRVDIMEAVRAVVTEVILPQPDAIRRMLGETALGLGVNLTDPLNRNNQHMDRLSEAMAHREAKER